MSTGCTEKPALSPASLLCWLGTLLRALVLPLVPTLSRLSPGLPGANRVCLVCLSLCPDYSMSNVCVVRLGPPGLLCPRPFGILVLRAVHVAFSSRLPTEWSLVRFKPFAEFVCMVVALCGAQIQCMLHAAFLLWCPAWALYYLTSVPYLYPMAVA